MADLSHTQNFLRSARLVDQLLDRAAIGPDDLVYEIGAGTGVVTARLAARCRRVLAIEKDPALHRLLRARFAGRSNVELRRGDALDDPLPTAPYKVFASLPFALTTAIVTRLTRAPRPPDDAYLAVQREAALRYLGAPVQTLYALLLRPWFEPSLVHAFRRDDFVPRPGVDVVLLRLRKRGPPLVSDDEAQRYRDFVVATFTAWRPSVRDALEVLAGARRAAELTRLVPEAACRPSAVPFDAWLRLFRAFAATADGAALARIAGAEARLRRQQARLRKVHRTRSSLDRRQVERGRSSENRGPPRLTTRVATRSAPARGDAPRTTPASRAVSPATAAARAWTTLARAPEVAAHP